MSLGRVVETVPTEELLARSSDPHTKALLAAVPRLEIRRKNLVAINGEIPSPLHPPAGCRFHPRCPHSMEQCRARQPQLREIFPAVKRLVTETSSRRSQFDLKETGCKFEWQAHISPICLQIERQLNKKSAQRSLDWPNFRYDSPSWTDS
jgi:oligopeptide/dipeptide ABC transporter ATP-binding protein